MNKKILVLENAMWMFVIQEQARLENFPVSFDKKETGKVDIIVVAASFVYSMNSNFKGYTITDLLIEYGHENTKLILTSASQDYLDEVSTAYCNEVDKTFLKSIKSTQDAIDLFNIIKEVIE